MALFKSFGKNPSGKELAHISQSPQYKDGSFHNFTPTEMMTAGTSMLKLIWKSLNKPSTTAPPKPLRPVKTNLRDLSKDNVSLVWFGHSSYFIQAKDKTILVDPVLSGNASPFSFGAKSFPGSDAYTTDDLPEIDILIITHDHYDHLDHRTIIKMLPKIRSVVTSLGVSAHLVSWGMKAEIITELDWWQTNTSTAGIELTAVPARHFSGRTMKRNQTLWSSFILRAADYTIYIGADSGYDSHFKRIGEVYGPFELAILETGQYNVNWPLIHMMPEEAVQACIELNARVLMPVHWAKFALAFHDWNEPARRVLKKALELNVKLTTPQIGEPLIVGESYPSSQWWEEL